MFHFRKDFSNLTRDYRAQDESGLPEITPVVIADDAREFAFRTRPQAQVSGTRAAVAAVFSTINIQATTLPLRVVAANTVGSAASNVRMSVLAATLITANAGTATPTSNLRGAAALTAVVNTGTAAAASLGYVTFDSTAAVDLNWLQFPQIFPLILRPGEFLSFQSATANITLSVCFFWEELRYGLLGNPPQLAP